MDLLNHLGRLRLVLVTGKGGTGKSTLTAALGERLAASGRRVLLLDVDPRESLYQLLGVPPSGGEIRRVAPRLWVQNLHPGDVLDRIVEERVPVRLIARRVLKSEAYRQFAATAPGLEELAVLGHALRVVRGLERETPEPDIVLLDAPASGHGLSLLQGPALVSEVIRSGPFGEMAGELATFVADAEACGVVVVTQAEEMPVTEAVELLAALRRDLARRPELVVVNALYPEFPADARPERGSALDLWRRRHLVNRDELRRLADHWSGPLIEVPLLAEERGPGLVHAVAETLGETLARPARPTVATGESS